tara:strand:+ start:305 stop:460 length:156 start_codon:yes stop_codon:yes gene_type:complete
MPTITAAGVNIVIAAAAVPLVYLGTAALELQMEGRIIQALLVQQAAALAAV